MKISQLPERMKRAEENKFTRTNKRATDDTAVKYPFMPQINHNVPDFNRAHDTFQKQLENKKSVHEPIRTMEFNMTKRETEKLKMSQNLTANQHNRTTEPPRHNAQVSLANFKRAEQSCKSKNVHSTKKFEETVRLRKQEQEEKRKKELEQKKEVVLKQER